MKLSFLVDSYFANCNVFFVAYLAESACDNIDSIFGSFHSLMYFEADPVKICPQLPDKAPKKPRKA